MLKHELQRFTTNAHQWVYPHDLLGNWYAVKTNYVGTFAFHPEHDHWFFKGRWTAGRSQALAAGHVPATAVWNRHRDLLFRTPSGSEAPRPSGS